MSLGKPTEQSPLLGQLQLGRSEPELGINGRLHDHGESDASNPLPPPDEQPSILRLALIMGSIWVCDVLNAQLGARG